MPRLSEKQINNILVNCNSANMQQLLDLCLDPESGITIDGLRAVKYNKIIQLEQKYYAQAEEIVWAKSQNDIDSLEKYIEQIKIGRFSDAHLMRAQQLLRELSAEKEENDWIAVKDLNDINKINHYIKRCIDGTYSDLHLQEAKERAEFVDWNNAKKSGNSAVVNGFIQKCNAGFYTNKYINDAKQELDRLENSTLVDDWNNLVVINDNKEKLVRLNEFIQKYAMNPTETAQRYMGKAGELMKKIEDDEKARIDWIDAKEEDTILGYTRFVSAHPYCDYREEAESRIANMKGNILNEMRRFPFKFTREKMYEYISTNALTMEDLVDKSNVLTDRGYSHIKKYPQLVMEQRELPVSRLENPTSEDGNTDVYFFGVSGSGKTCVLAGLMSLTGQLGFRFDPKGPGGGGNYAMELRNYARTSMLPPPTDQSYIQVIDAQINDENGNLHKIALIEMSGEKTAQFAAMDTQENFDDLGPGASGLMNNNNPKVIFFVIDPTNEKNVELGQGSQQWVMQSDVLGCVSSLLSKYKGFMKKVVAIHVILTKSDTLGDYVDQNLITEKLNGQGYQAVLSDIKSICEQYDINKQTGFKVGLYPFCVGKFMPGDVYTFDETDSLKILRVIQKNTVIKRNTDGPLDVLIRWFNS